jgi:cholesterol transport system auxiliary component
MRKAPDMTLPAPERRAGDPARHPTTALPLALSLALASCAVGSPPPAPLRYDFGAAPPPAEATGAPAATGVKAVAPELALEIQPGPALDGTAMSYRLAYADPRQLRAYRDARWIAPPAELLQQRLRAALARDVTLLPAGEAAPRTLNLEVQDMVQVFDQPGHSVGVLRLRATLLQRNEAGVSILGQREGQWQAEAPTADAAGGALALQTASDAAARDLAQWVSGSR